MVFCPLIASIATRALNSAVNCRRFLVVIVSPCLEAMILHLKYLSEFWGAAQGAPKSADRNVEGAVEMMLDTTQNYGQALTAERLFSWHAALFPTNRIGMEKIGVGAWRDGGTGPMQVISVPIGEEHVHFEAPVAAHLDTEMTAFLDWLNSNADIDLVLKAGLAHIWFVTIHSFNDGNGRVARAIDDLLLARSEDSPQRFYSVSSQIRHERSAYYSILEHTQKGTMDVTSWLEWFLACLGRAMDGAQTIPANVFAKASFWEKNAGIAMNDRQRLMLNRLLDGFEGKLTTSEYAKLANCSQDTALRDVIVLVEHGILMKNPAGGRSASYSLINKPTQDRSSK
jgi:Fic family protein